MLLLMFPLVFLQALYSSLTQHCGLGSDRLAWTLDEEVSLVAGNSCLQNHLAAAEGKADHLASELAQGSGYCIPVNRIE
jgi:hypothetical protein